jgi:protein gp37
VGENTKIEWATHTFNPWVGCAKVSPACTNCYAEGWAKRTGQAGLWRGERRRTSAQNWRLPLKWNRDTPGARVFCSSLADVFEDREDLNPWRDELHDLILHTPRLTWMLLTKRPDVALRFPGITELPNVWVGATVEDQQRADQRIPHLLRVPAAVRFLSCEPLLGPVQIGVGDSFFDYGVGGHGRSGIHWVIAGGESGPNARPSHQGWFRSLQRQCDAANVPFFFKQWGEWAPANAGAGGDIEVPPAGKRVGFFDYNGHWNEREHPNPFRQTMVRLGKGPAGRLLDGVQYDGVPVVGGAR